MLLEIRTYRLKPGTSAAFTAAVGEALPMLAAHGIRVVRAGLSDHAEDGHEEAYLIRAFASAADRERREAEFYGGDAWRSGPRDAVLSCIETYHTVTMEADAEAVARLGAAATLDGTTAAVGIPHAPGRADDTSR